MTYYNSLVAEKLKTLSEIQRINKQIDSHKKDKKGYSEQLEKIEQLKVQLELINSQILSYTLKTATEPSPPDVPEDFPDVLSAPESTIENIQENLNNDSAGLLPE